MSRFLVLCAPSGTGKTFLLETLCSKYSNLFYKVEQVTTRARREGEGDTYHFIDKKTYDVIESELIGKTEINGTYYGSLPDKDDNRIGIIILNELGFKNFINEVPNKADYFSIGLNKDLDSIEVRRENRDEEFLKKEKHVLEMCDVVFNLKDSYANPDIIKSLTLTYFINHLNRVELIATEDESYISTNYYSSNVNITIGDAKNDDELFIETASQYKNALPHDFDCITESLTEMVKGIKYIFDSYKTKN